ncbi:uncharacterized protein CLUP02_11739 [Colletotrichum lupini]|uniref:Uncharacterized protein n=1 Tax=Colletotrichum lupini TaxID=145971 RepID=A0A9Q8SZ43_9PEZI|nr:uncharacterized protein CLUP02_11739 [Colletotrichum lupini]UQC86239.1 hypothetical protein CLUP02_11739 [Colletotrichum lupini]
MEGSVVGHKQHWWSWFLTKRPVSLGPRGKCPLKKGPGKREGSAPAMFCFATVTDSMPISRGQVLAPAGCFAGIAVDFSMVPAHNWFELACGTSIVYAPLQLHFLEENSASATVELCYSNDGHDYCWYLSFEMMRLYSMLTVFRSTSDLYDEPNTSGYINLHVPANHFLKWKHPDFRPKTQRTRIGCLSCTQQVLNWDFFLTQSQTWTPIQRLPARELKLERALLIRAPMNGTEAGMKSITRHT